MQRSNSSTMLAAPLPADTTLEGLPYMPLDVVAIRDSRLVTVGDAEAVRAALLLWCAAWQQTPAASLPTDDCELAVLSGYGREKAGWLKVKDEALRGWVEHNNGRLYHPRITAFAKAAWAKRQALRRRSEAGNKARWGSKSNGKKKKPNNSYSSSHKDSLRNPARNPKKKNKAPMDTPPKRGGIRRGDAYAHAREPLEAARGERRVPHESPISVWRNALREYPHLANAANDPDFASALEKALAAHEIPHDQLVNLSRQVADSKRLKDRTTTGAWLIEHLHEALADEYTDKDVLMRRKGQALASTWSDAMHQTVGHLHPKHRAPSSSVAGGLHPEYIEGLANVMRTPERIQALASEIRQSPYLQTQTWRSWLQEADVILAGNYRGKPKPIPDPAEVAATLAELESQTAAMRGETTVRPPP